MKKKITFPSLAVLICASAFCQDTAGPNNPSSGANDASVGVISWANLSNVTASDGANATATALSTGTNSEYLVITGFSFSIPDGSTIKGITVEINRSATFVLTVGTIQVSDNSVRIVKGGSIAGDEKAIVGFWPSSNTYQSYGGASDLWGTTWSVSDINSSNFGIAVSANLDGAVLPRARVDHARITITYTSPLSADLAYLSTECHEGKITANWGIVAQQNNAYFTLERSEDQHHYQEVGRVEGQGTTNEFNSYELEDTKRVTSSTWYRLSQTDYDGQHTILATQKPDCATPSELQLFPNPTEYGYFIANYNFSKHKTYCLTVHDLRGIEVRRQFKDGDESLLVDGNNWPPGIYLVKLIENNCIVATERLVIK